MCGFINVRYKTVQNSRAHKNADGCDHSGGGGGDDDPTHLLNIYHVQVLHHGFLQVFNVPKKHLRKGIS